MTQHVAKIEIAPSAASDVLPLVRRTIVNLQSAFAWAWLDIVCQYRRSRIGPFWNTINVAVTVAGLSIVASGIFGGNMSDMIGYIGLGIIVWSAISSIIGEGCMTFVQNAPQIRSTNVSIDLYVGRTVFKTFIIFGHQIVLYAVGLAFGFVSPSWTCLLAVPGLLLIFINACWVVATLGFLCARFRDLEPIIRNLLTLAFLVTPVFWNAQQMVSHRRFIVDYNPLYHFIAIVRAPLLGEVPAVNSYVAVTAITVLGYLAAYVVYQRMRRRLAHFV